MDWKQLIADLQNDGSTQPYLAELCGCKQSSISDLATGKTKEPRYQIGRALIEEHARMVKRNARKQRSPIAQEA